jgi:L-lysine 2,3-aminomutase
MISLRSIAKQYGYDESTVRQWKAKGMPQQEEEAREWIIEHVLKPLRETDLNEQIQRERLRKLQAEADLSEAEVQKSIGNLLDAEQVEQELSKYFKTLRDYIRTLPNRVHHELHEQENALNVKRVLLQRIDEVLNEIGQMTLEGSFKDEHIKVTEKDSTKSTSTS